MGNETIGFLLITWLYCVMSVIQLIQHKKEMKNLFKELKTTTEQLLEKMKKELVLKKIMINAKETKENYFKTLEKIEKELFKDNNSSKDF